MNNNVLYPIMNPPSSCEEKQHLLLPSASKKSSSSIHHHQQYQLNCHSWRCLCLPPKSVIVLICLTLVVSTMYKIFSIVCVTVYITVLSENHIYKPLAYLLGFLALLLYPISGFIADVFCGRFRALVVSMCLFIVSFLLLMCATVLIMMNPELFPLQWSHSMAVLFILMIILYGVTFGIGSIIYYANYVQFGIDQLMEASSRHLSLFVHWIIWADTLLSVIIIPLILALYCHNNYFPVKILLCSVPFICFIILIFLLILSICKRHWFYTEPGHNNPYKVVIKVLIFAWKHKYPLQRSAFTYCDDERPSRLDFAKERFGGPFRTEQVEDVKTLFRIVIVLLVLGPIFVLDLPNTVFGFLLIGVHTSHRSKEYCDANFF